MQTLAEHRRTSVTWRDAKGPPVMRRAGRLPPRVTVHTIPGHCREVARHDCAAGSASRKAGWDIPFN